MADLVIGNKNMSSMRAARYYGNRDIQVEDVQIPVPGPGECLVEVEWFGICDSDLHEYVAGTINSKVSCSAEQSATPA